MSICTCKFKRDMRTKCPTASKNCSDKRRQHTPSKCPLQPPTPLPPHTPPPHKVPSPASHQSVGRRPGGPPRLWERWRFGRRHKGPVSGIGTAGTAHSCLKKQMELLLFHRPLGKLTHAPPRKNPLRSLHKTASSLFYRSIVPWPDSPLQKGFFPMGKTFLHFPLAFWGEHGILKKTPVWANFRRNVL